MRPTLPLVLLLLPTLGLTACNPCAERCRVESRAITDCLDDWGLEWDDFDAEDAKDFREQCVATEQIWIDSLEGEERRAETSACWDLTEDLRVADSCEQTWSALTDYGSD